MRRVVITGIGVVAPNGVGRGEFWSNCCHGQSGIRTIRAFDASRHAIRVAGEVPEFSTELIPEQSRKSVKLMSRSAYLGLAAAHLAIQDSQLDWRNHNPERRGVVMGTGVVPLDLHQFAPLIAQATEQGQFNSAELGTLEQSSSLFPLWLLRQLPNMVAAHISMAFQAQGPNNTIVTACVAGTQAIGEAYRLIAQGEADVILAGGSDSRIDPLLLLGYVGLGTVTTADRPAEELSRPFDRLRDGFVIGEGAAVLILEDYEHAAARGAEIYAEVKGFGSSFDAYSITKPDPSGEGAARAIRAALREARTNPEQVKYINAHGTSTRLNDVMETAAVKTVFGDHARRMSMSSIKSMIGHAIGAAGAIEAAALALTIKTGIAPPTINLTHPDPACDLDYVPLEARDTAVKVGLSTSFGFGGQNGALVLAAA